MRKLFTIFLCIFLILLFLNCWTFIHRQLPPICDNKRLYGDPQTNLSSAVIPLNQVPTHPNLTYSLKSQYDDRYFGSDIFNLTIYKSQGPALDIIIPLGQFLNAIKSNLQNMTIAQPTFINLSADADSESILLTAYCINVRGDVPQRIDNYTIVNENATGYLYLILNYIYNNNSLYDFHYTQLAVWAATDGPNQIPSGYIYNNTEVAWANALLAAVGTPYVIPDVPTIPSFSLWLVIAGLGLSLLISLRRKEYGRNF